MSKYRIKFKKEGRIKFIGHLDLLKLFQKAIKRAGIPIKYSLGFNPHQKVSFAQPLSLGMESICEYVDIELNQDMNGDEIVSRLNKAMPDGMEFVEAIKMKEGYKGSASELRRATYLVTANGIPQNIDAILENIMSQQSIIIRKKTKSKDEETDIRPDIFQLTAADDGIRMTISTGSLRHVKPDLVVGYIFSHMSSGSAQPSNVNYKRIDMEMGE